MTGPYTGRNLEDLVCEARRRAGSSPYHGCATAVFTALVDTLGLNGGDEVFKAMIGLAGGTGHLTRGTCGALAGAASAISLSYNKGREETVRLMEDPKNLHPADQHMLKFFQEMFDKIAEVAKKMYEKYGSVNCDEIQFNMFGKTLNLLLPEKHREFLESLQYHSVNCYTLEADVAGWAVEVILAD